MSAGVLKWISISALFLAGGGLTNGTVINLLTTLPPGSNTSAMSAADNVGNTSSPSVTIAMAQSAGPPRRIC